MIFLKKIQDLQIIQNYIIEQYRLKKEFKKNLMNL